MPRVKVDEETYPTFPIERVPRSSEKEDPGFMRKKRQLRTYKSGETDFQSFVMAFTKKKENEEEDNQMELVREILRLNRDNERETYSPRKS